MILNREAFGQELENHVLCSLMADVQAICWKGYRGHGVPCDSLSCEDKKLQLHLQSQDPPGGILPSLPEHKQNQEPRENFGN